ncbi:MAG: hypothetical protein DRP01_10155 [Archaeoglobales archaeon]|nr:MAG: hypothetical protein DRP01_10155 [Archaeoglobales archaeon]
MPEAKFTDIPAQRSGDRSSTVKIDSLSCPSNIGESFPWVLEVQAKEPFPLSTKKRTKLLSHLPRKAPRSPFEPFGLHHVRVGDLPRQMRSPVQRNLEERLSFLVIAYTPGNRRFLLRKRFRRITEVGLNFHSG